MKSLITVRAHSQRSWNLTHHRSPNYLAPMLVCIFLCFSDKLPKKEETWIELTEVINFISLLFARFDSMSMINFSKTLGSPGPVIFSWCQVGEFSLQLCWGTGDGTGRQQDWTLRRPHSLFLACTPRQQIMIVWASALEQDWVNGGEWRAASPSF